MADQVDPERAGEAVVRQVDEAVARIGELAAARVGVSSPYESITDSPAALRSARLAARSAGPGETSPVRYGESPVNLLLATSPEASRVLAEQVLAPLLALPAAEREALIETLTAWFNCGGSSSDVAEKLHFHRNTIHQRLRRSEQLTGRSHTDPVASAELYVALRALALS